MRKQLVAMLCMAMLVGSTVYCDDDVETQDLVPESNVYSVMSSGMLGDVLSAKGVFIRSGLIVRYEIPQPEPEIYYDPYTGEEMGAIVETRVFRCTAYCPCVICCNQYSPDVTGGVSHTATGTEPMQGRTVAVDPSIIPYGTRLVINGQVYIAEDCGGAIIGDSIDIFYSNHADAEAFGLKYLEVSILE